MAKQSGVPGVQVEEQHVGLGGQMSKVGRQRKDHRHKPGRKFSISSFMKQGLTEDEADAAALEAAKAFRADLIRQGLVKEPKAKDPQFTSDVVGVRWR